MENIVCLIFTGKIESRKGFIIGPFCPIYGFGAVLLTCLLPHERKKWVIVLIGGLLVGTWFEYFSSYCMEALYGVKFWNYTGTLANLNGRTNIMYATCWGILSLLLIYTLNPKVDKFIKYFEFKSLDIIILLFMLINGVITYNEINGYVNHNKNRLLNNKTIEIIFPNMELQNISN